MANPQHEALFERAEAFIKEAIHEWKEHNPGVTLDLRETQKLAGRTITVDLDGADLGGANLRRCVLDGSSLREVNIKGADLFEADLARTDLRELKGARGAKHLETVRLPAGPALYFETCHRKWPEKYFDWEQIRRLGRLPLFGASYFVLGLILIFVYGLDLYPTLSRVRSAKFGLSGTIGV